MSRQSALLKHFHEELERPNPVADLEKKLQATKAAAEKRIQVLTKERDILKASRAELKAKISTTASNFDQLKLENTKLSKEKKEMQVTLSKAQEQMTSLTEETKLLSRVRDQLQTDKAALEVANDKLKAEVQEQSHVISNGGYMAFASCLKQVVFLNPGVKLSFKGVHPLHGVEGSRLLDYDNDPPTHVDPNDPELEAFDPHADYSKSPTTAEDEDVAPAEP
jgi:myosin heavy subunit